MKGRFFSGTAGSSEISRLRIELLFVVLASSA
jgi:hypothetical protein